MSSGQEAFQERLEKLGVAQDMRAPDVEVTRVVKPGPPHWTENLGYPASLVGAFVAGLVSVFLARWATSHVTDGASDNADLTLLMDATVAFGIVFILRTALHMTEKEHIACKTAGIWVSLTMMHNLVHAYPEHFAFVYTPAWVEHVTGITEPNSFYFRGYSFPFGDAPAQGEAETNGVKINRY